MCDNRTHDCRHHMSSNFRLIKILITINSELIVYTLVTKNDNIHKYRCSN